MQLFGRKSKSEVARLRATQMMMEAEAGVTSEGKKLQKFNVKENYDNRGQHLEYKDIYRNPARKKLNKKAEENIIASQQRKRNVTSSDSSNSFGKEDSKLSSQRRSIEMAIFNEMYGEGGHGGTLNKEGLQRNCQTNLTKSKSSSFGSFLSLKQSLRQQKSELKTVANEKNEKTVYRGNKESRDPELLFEIDHLRASQDRVKCENKQEGTYCKERNMNKEKSKTGFLGKTRNELSQSLSRSSYVEKKAIVSIKRNGSMGFLYGKKNVAEMNQIAYSQAQQMMAAMEVSTEGLELNRRGLQVLTTTSEKTHMMTNIMAPKTKSKMPSLMTKNFDKDKNNIYSGIC